MTEKKNCLENCFELYVYKSPIFVCVCRGGWLQYICFAARFICILPHTGFVWKVSGYDSSFQIQKSKITQLPLAYIFRSVCLAFLHLMFQDFKMDFSILPSTCSRRVTTKMKSAMKMHFLHRYCCLDFLW